MNIESVKRLFFLWREVLCDGKYARERIATTKRIPQANEVYGGVCCLFILHQMKALLFIHHDEDYDFKLKKSESKREILSL
jgi:hypothetical protein